MSYVIDSIVSIPNDQIDNFLTNYDEKIKTANRVHKFNKVPFTDITFPKEINAHFVNFLIDISINYPGFLQLSQQDLKKCIFEQEYYYPYINDLIRLLGKVKKPNETLFYIIRDTK